MPLKAGQGASWDSRGVLRGVHPRAVKIRWSCRCAKTGLQRAPSSLCWASFLPVSMGTDGDEWRLILVCIGAGKKKGVGFRERKGRGTRRGESPGGGCLVYSDCACVLAGGMRQTSLRQTSLRHPRGHEWKRTRKPVVTSHVPGALCGWTVWLEPKGKGSSALQEWSGTGVRVWQIHWIHSTDIFWVPAVCQALCVVRLGVHEARPGVGHRDTNPAEWDRGGQGVPTERGSGEAAQRTGSIQWVFEGKLAFLMQTGACNTLRASVLQSLMDERHSPGNRWSWVGIWGALSLTVWPQANDLTLWALVFSPVNWRENTPCVVGLFQRLHGNILHDQWNSCGSDSATIQASHFTPLDLIPHP